MQEPSLVLVKIPSEGGIGTHMLVFTCRSREAPTQEFPGNTKGTTASLLREEMLLPSLKRLFLEVSLCTGR